MGITLGCGDAADGSASEVDGTEAAIVGGWAATAQQIFATVEIRRSGAETGFCSGALISPSVVVTAAHCAVVEPETGIVAPAEPGSLWVAAGHLASREVTEERMRRVSKIRVHESYDHDFIMGRSRAGAGQGGLGAPDDIALLLLERPFDDAPLAPLLTPERSQTLVRHGDVGFVAGYGVYDLDAGRNGELYITDAIIDIIGSRELLTRRYDQLGDSCYGDSGGPLYVPTEEGDYLVGIVSRGRSDVERDCGDGGVYTMISVHLPWIVDAAGEQFDPRFQPVDASISFLQEGADPIEARRGGSLRGACAAAGPVSGLPWSSLVALGAVIAISRRLSRRSL